MCGRFAIDERVNAAVVEWVRADDSPQGWQPADWIDPTTLTPRYSVAPGQVLPVMHYARSGASRFRTLSFALWGFSPAWARRPGPRPINARLETIATNGLFRVAFRSGRCIVPMSGYFEWTDTVAGKQPRYITRDAPLYACAIAARNQPDEGEVTTVAIITRQAADASGEIHDRMPVFLPQSELDAWIGTEPVRDGDAVAFLSDRSRTEAATLHSFAVSQAVNNVRTANPEDASLIAPVDPASPGTPEAD